MSSLIHLIYNSASTIPVSAQDLEMLLFKARNKNAALDITGMLIYVDGCFFQILEGPQDAVDALATTIKSDPRHTRMTTIIREPIAKRSFKEWTMGYARVDANQIGEIEGFTDFFSTSQNLTNVDAGRAKKLLAAFKEGRWRVKLAAQPAVETISEHVLINTAKSTPNAVSQQARPDYTFAFQPIINAKEMRVAGYEALARGLSGELAEDILQQVPLQEIAAFDEDGHRKAIAMASRLKLTSELHLNVISKRMGKGLESIDSVLQTALFCGLDLNRIVLEIKHQTAIMDPNALIAWLDPYRQKGVKICIDDFGSGYAGAAVLDHYQPDYVSLSRWIAQDIEGNGPRQAIVRGLKHTCDDLGIEIIAKGVETTGEFEWFRDEGIELFQGFLFARPGFECLPSFSMPA